MQETIRFGTVRGIAVGCNWSVLAIAALIAWGLADGYLPDTAPGYAVGEYWLVAALAVVCFFGALLTHELAHSVVAQRQGVQVESITLWLFGGVARLRGEAATARAELKIAVAGPATSVTASIGFGLAAWAVGGTIGSDLLFATLAWLTLINGIIAVFNLAPAAPLDGGRVLHAFVWGATHDRHRATRVATTAGRWFGYLLIGVGILMVAGGNLGGAWMALIGWFVITAAGAEATHSLLQGALAGVRVRDVMTDHPVVVRADHHVDDVLEQAFLRHHCSSFPVVDGSGHVLGLLTLRRVRKVAPDHRALRTAGDEAIPIAQVAIVGPDDPLVEVLEHADPDAAGDGRMLVFDGGHLVGIVSPNDVNRAVQLAALRGERPPAD
ncbi:MAG: site-2 protease family protein [Actinomycetota bacterium]